MTRQVTRLWTLPNLLGLFRLAITPVLVALVLLPFAGGGILAFILFVPAALSDLLDGWLARARGQVSTLGVFLDLTADKVLVAALLIALAQAGVAPAWLVIVIVVREFIVSGVRQVAANAQVIVASEAVGKAKTVTVLVAIGALLLALDARTGGPLATTGIGPLAQVAGGWLLLAAVLLALVSGIDYLIKAWPILVAEHRDEGEPGTAEPGTGEPGTDGPRPT
jgi:CDP-diacylglycerol--glycerol-3-phosphate 3-phosphatidyltransferase